MKKLPYCPRCGMKFDDLDIEFNNLNYCPKCGDDLGFKTLEEPKLNFLKDYTFTIKCNECNNSGVIRLDENKIKVFNFDILANNFEPEVIIKCLECGNEIIEEIW